MNAYKKNSMEEANVSKDIELATGAGGVGDSNSGSESLNLRTSAPSSSVGNITLDNKDGSAETVQGAAKALAADSASSAVADESGAAGKVAFACFLYSSCSIAMVLVNKSLASSYSHLIDGDLNFLIVICQAVVAVICVEFSKSMKWVEYPPFNINTARLWAPVNILFCAMLFTGMASLQHNSVPMVTVFKNITNIVISAGEYYFFGTRVDIFVAASFAVMLGGAVMAAWNDSFITSSGLFWMGMNCIATSGYILYMKFATKTVKLSKFGMVFYNNVLCTFFLLPVTIANGEMRTFFSTPAIHTPDYFVKNFFAGFIGFFLNFASLNCVAQTGPTTYAIIGSMNKIPIAIFGYVLFDNKITSETWFFIVVSMCGGFLYSYAKIRSSNLKKRGGGR